MACRRFRCPDCNDRLIHQTMRGPHESSSGYGQHIHEHPDKEFYFIDLDGVTLKVRDGLIRIVENKRSDEHLSNSQRSIMPLLADGVKSLVESGRVNNQSGVFLVRSDPPYESADVRQFGGGLRALLDPPTFEVFKTGRPLPNGSGSPVEWSTVTVPVEDPEVTFRVLVRHLDDSSLRWLTKALTGRVPLGRGRR